MRLRLRLVLVLWLVWVVVVLGQGGVFEELIDSGAEVSVEALVARVDGLVEEGRMQEAESVLMRALKREPGDVALLRRLVDLARMRGDVPGALRGLESLQRAEPGVVRWRLLEARVVLESGSRIEAQGLYEQLVEDHSELAEARFYLAVLRAGREQGLVLRVRMGALTVAQQAWMLRELVASRGLVLRLLPRVRFVQVVALVRAGGEEAESGEDDPEAMRMVGDAFLDRLCARLLVEAELVDRLVGAGEAESGRLALRARGLGLDSAALRELTEAED